MDYTTFKSEGGTIHPLHGREYRYYPESCANRVTTPWVYIGDTPAKFGTWRFTYGNRTPNYWKLRREGKWIPPQAFYSAIREVSAQGSSFRRLDWPAAPTCTSPNIYFWDELKGKFMPYKIPASYVCSGVPEIQKNRDLITEVVTKCFANRQKGDANFVETLAELDQTFALLQSPTGQLGKFADEFVRARSYRRLQRLRGLFPGVNKRSQMHPTRRRTPLGKEYLSLLSSEYLRWRYGILPIIADVKSALKILRRNYKKAAVTDFHTARANGTISGSMTDNYTGSDSVLDYSWSCTRVQTVSVRALWVDQYAASPWSDLGLSWHNAVAVPWELLNKSFVADWFANIGDLIYANIPRVDVNPMGGSYFVRNETYNLWFPTGWNVIAGGSAVLSGSQSDTVTISIKEKSRTVIDSARATGLVIKSDFRFDQHTRLADAIALTLQKLRRIAL